MVFICLPRETRDLGFRAKAPGYPWLPVKHKQRDSPTEQIRAKVQESYKQDSCCHLTKVP